MPSDVAAARKAQRAKWGRFGLLQVDPRTGTPRAVGRLDGFLTGESARDNADIALDHVRSHPELFGLDGGDLDALRLVDRTPSSLGVERIVWEQSYRGVPAIDTMLIANVSATGRLVNVLGSPRADLTLRSVEPRMTGAEAYAAAAAQLGGARAGTGDLVIYEGDGGPRLGWRVWLAASKVAVFDAVVDDGTGEVVRQRNMVEGVDGSVFKNYPGAPVGGEQETVTLDVNAGATSLIGPSVHAFKDLNDSVGYTNALQGYEPFTGQDVAPGAFGFVNQCGAANALPRCSWTGSGSTHSVNADVDAVNLFWLVDTFHDHLASTDIGFDRASGNFEGTDNRVLAQALDGAATGADGGPDADHVDNANMLTPRDGFKPSMQMYLTKANAPTYASTGLDASVVYHEYTHGFNARIVKDAQGFGAMGGAQGGAFNEGNSDFFAYDYLDQQGLESDAGGSARDVMGGLYSFGTLRSQPADCRVDDQALPECQPYPGASTGSGGYTFGDFGKVYVTPEVHGDGEIWTQIMWQLRDRLIADRGTRLAGIARTRRLLSAAMRLVPPNPSFLDWRNALLQADTNDSGDDDSVAIWAVFAERGLGYFASTTGPADVAPTESFSLPPAASDPPATVVGSVVDDVTGTAQSGVTVSFAGFDSGIGPQLSDATDAAGDYVIAGAGAGTFPSLRTTSATGYDRASRSVTVAPGVNTQDFALRRNYAASAGGATITGEGINYSGCGFAQAIDGNAGTVWSTDNNATRSIVIDLPATITVGAVEIDPSAGCGDGPEASLGQYSVGAGSTAASTPQIAAGTFGASDIGRFNSVVLSGGLTNVGFVRLSAITPQNAAAFMDVSEVKVFAAGATATAPVATTSPATALTDTSAILNGTVDANNGATDYQFQYGPTTGYGTSAPSVPQPIGQGSSALRVSQALSGLTAGTLYHYRLVAYRNGAAVHNGPDQTFTTTGGAAPVDPEPVTAAESAVGATGAVLNATVDPNGTATDYQFEYGPTTTYGTSVPVTPATVGSGTAPVAFSQALTGLTPSSTYHYRVVAVRGASRFPGLDESFVTPPAGGGGAPTVQTLGEVAASLTAIGTTVEGTVNPNGLPTTFHVSYGLNGAFGFQTVDVAVGSGTTPVTVRTALAGLTPGTSYSWKIVATNADGTSEGSIDTFTTGPPSGLPAGPAGDTGPTGPQGPIGPTGTGTAGATGPKGDTGLQGIAGPAGKDGAPGLKGANGTNGVKGRNATVVCKVPKARKGKVKVSCKVTFAAAAGRAVTARLSRNGRTVADGSTRRARGGAVTLTGTRSARAGRHRLSLRVGRGATARTIRLVVDLR